MSHISWEPCGSALEYTGYSAMKFGGIVSSCGKHTRSMEIDSHVYGRDFGYILVSSSTGSYVNFVLVLGRWLLESFLTLTSLSFHPQPRFDNHTSRLSIHRQRRLIRTSVITFAFGHDIVHFSGFLQDLHVRRSRHEVDGVLCRLSIRRPGTPLVANVLLDYAKYGAADVTESQGQTTQYYPREV